MANALAELGDSKSADIVQERLANILAKGEFNHGTRDMTFCLVDALGELKHKPARDTVDDALFLYFGLDPVVVTNPGILAHKQETEAVILKKALEALKDQPAPEVAVNSFIMNRREIENTPQTERETVTILHAKIHQPDAPNISFEEAMPSKRHWQNQPIFHWTIYP